MFNSKTKFLPLLVLAISVAGCHVNGEITETKFENVIKVVQTPYVPTGSEYTIFYRISGSDEVQITNFWLGGQLSIFTDVPHNKQMWASIRRESGPFNKIYCIVTNLELHLHSLKDLELQPKPREGREENREENIFD